MALWLPVTVCFGVTSFAICTSASGAAPVIKTQPDNVIVRRNEPATLNCAAVGETTITWFNDGKQVMTTKQDHRSHRVLLPSGSLFFLRVSTGSRSTDAGTYWCVASNSHGATRSRNATLDVASISYDFQAQPEPLVRIRAGSSAFLPCKPPKGFPEPSIKWLKNGQEVANSSRIFVTPDGDLVIKETVDEDSAIYTCSASNIAGIRESVPSRVVVMKGAPVIKTQPDNVVVTRNDPAILNCAAAGATSITWFHDGEQVVTAPQSPCSNRVILPPGSLFFLRVAATGRQDTDVGTYWCVASNSHGVTRSRNATLSVASISDDFQALPEPLVKIRSGGSASLPCRPPKGSPEPSIKWLKNGQEVTNSSRIFVTSDGDLVIKETMDEDSATYVCSASNIAGNRKSSPTVMVVMMSSNTTQDPADSIVGYHHSWKSSAMEVGVIIVGGGVVGLTAARALLENNFTDILLLEADDRIGGRVEIYEEEEEETGGGKDFRVMTSDGQEVDGRHYDILSSLLEELQSEDFQLQHRNQSIQETLTKRFREMFKNWDSAEGRSWFHALEKRTNIEFGIGNWASDTVGDAISRISLESNRDRKSRHNEIIKNISKSFPEGIVRTSTSVTKIFWDDEGKVLLVANNGLESFLTNHVILTAPVGNLEEEKDLFEPRLPCAVVNDLKDVKFASMNEIQMGWLDPWWGSEDPLSLVVIWKNFNLPKEMEWLYGIVMVRSLEEMPSVLQAYVSGEEAVLMEKLPDDTLKEHFLHILRKTTGLVVPEPTFFKKTVVGQDPVVRESQSAYVVESLKTEEHERFINTLVNSRGMEVILWSERLARFSTSERMVDAGERAANDMMNILQIHPANILTGNYEMWNASAVEVDVIIIGAGVAGLSAAKTLLENDVTDILILEAEHRIGGRVRTLRQGDILVEEGAEWVHGNGSELYRIAKELDALSPFDDPYQEKTRLTTNYGVPVNASVFELMEMFYEGEEGPAANIFHYFNEAVGKYYEDMLLYLFDEHFPSDIPGNIPPKEAWKHFLEMLESYEWGFDSWMDITLRNFWSYENYDDKDYQWKNGYDTFLNYMKKSIPDNIIRTSSPVSKVFWDEVEDDEGRVLVVAENGRTSYSARHVITTTSVGHLKERHQTLFQPPLPNSLVKSLDDIYLSVADKIIIGWSEPWWDSLDASTFFVIWTNRTLPKEMDWIYGLAISFTIHQQPNILELFISGDNARRMEALPESVVKQHVLHFLRSSSGLKVPEPTFFKRSRWGLDPWKKGSYCSLVTVDGERNGLLNRQQFREPLKNSKGVEVVLWAGEHTHDTRYSTVDGAMETGKREAQNLLQILKEKAQTQFSPEKQQTTKLSP